MTTAALVARPRDRATPAPPAACAACSARAFTFCHMLARVADPLRPPATCLAHAVHSVPARRRICREHDVLSTVPVICTGWAAASVMLSDGSRQILSFLLPGDIVSAALLFESKPGCIVESITNVTYRSFSRAALFEMLAADPGAIEPLARLLIDEKKRAEATVVDLGRRSAAQRIARLILGLVERLQQRNMTMRDPFEFEFPLRQHHIADATGLTAVHVSKLLSEFRRRGLIRLGERTLGILDPAGLSAAAEGR